MDAQRTTLVLTLAALIAGPALAAPPSETAPVRYSNTAPSKSSWASGAPTVPPTISASPNNRYANPQAGYPQNAYPQANYPQATYPQNAAPANANNGIRTAANTPQQTSGTSSYPSSQSTNPFATQPAAPPANSNTSNNLAPPPWPTNSGTPSPPPTSSWDSTPVTPVDRSMLANPTPPPTNVGWTSIGTSVAAPPLTVPPLTSSTSNLPPLNSTPFNNGPALTTDSYRGDQPSYNSAQYSAPPTAPPATSRSAAPPDNWAASFDGSSDNNRAPVERAANTPSRPVTTRDSDYPNSPRIGASQPDIRSTAAKPADSGIDTSWLQNSQTSTGPAAAIGGPKSATVGSAPGAAPFGQSANNGPPPNPPVVGSVGNNMNFNGANPNGQQQQQQPTAGNGGKLTQTGAPTGEPQSWTVQLLAILGLAGSLAGNIYLSWSYMDARQKYQALVRRTADTFRRTKVAA